MMMMQSATIPAISGTFCFLVDEAAASADGETVGDTVGAVGETVGDTVCTVGETVGDTVGAVGETVGDTVGETVGDIVTHWESHCQKSI